jgi:hypothetical protein
MTTSALWLPSTKDGASSNAATGCNGFCSALDRQKAHVQTTGAAGRTAGLLSGCFGVRAHGGAIDPAAAAILAALPERISPFAIQQIETGAAA